MPIFMMSRCASIMDNIKTPKSNNTGHTVTLGNQRTFPSCNCENWKFNRMPCSHFLRIFKETEIRYDSLSPLYRANPCFQIDLSCVRNKSKGLPSAQSSSSNIDFASSNTDQNTGFDSVVDFQNESITPDAKSEKNKSQSSSITKPSGARQVPPVKSKRKDEAKNPHKTIQMLSNKTPELPSIAKLIGAKISPVGDDTEAKMKASQQLEKLEKINMGHDTVAKMKASQQLEKLNNIRTSERTTSANEKIRVWLKEQRQRKEIPTSKTAKHATRSTSNQVSTVIDSEPAKGKIDSNQEMVGKKHKLTSPNIAITKKKSMQETNKTELTKRSNKPISSVANQTEIKER